MKMLSANTNPTIRLAGGEVAGSTEASKRKTIVRHQWPSKSKLNSRPWQVFPEGVNHEGAHDKRYNSASEGIWLCRSCSGDAWSSGEPPFECGPHVPTKFGANGRDTVDENNPNGDCAIVDRSRNHAHHIA